MATIAAPASANRNEEFTLPFELTKSGHLVVDITLNGGMESRAILDTGATFPLVGRETGAIFGAAQDLPDARMVEVIGLGLSAIYPVIGLDDVRFGPLSFDRVEAAYNEAFRVGGADTVLPAAMFPHRTLDFDFSQSRLHVYDRRPDRVYRGTTSRMPITWINDLPFVEVSVDGTRGLALIDTGASVSFINAAFARSAARSQTDFRQVEVIGATGEAVPIKVLSSRRFAIGKFEVVGFDVVVLDPGFLDNFGLQDEPVMVMGLDMLSQFRVQVDRHENELRISQPPPRGMPAMRVYLN